MIDDFHPLMQDISSYIAYAEKEDLIELAKDAGAVGEAAQAELEMRSEFGDEEE